MRARFFTIAMVSFVMGWFTGSAYEASFWPERCEVIEPWLDDVPADITPPPIKGVIWL